MRFVPFSAVMRSMLSSISPFSPHSHRHFQYGKRKERFLQITAFVLIPPIAFSRMVLGAHYLSDISAGMLCGLGFVILYEILVHNKK
ncbi:MAG: phosphatase PAP2 family protein [Oscillospiraceae bacterium]|nr:phosphatase PAP2 family protein [Oscillospiraceae bacterium]